jgi:hypothetical protein
MNFPRWVGVLPRWFLREVSILLVKSWSSTPLIFFPLWFLLFLQSEEDFKYDWKRRDFVASCVGFVPTAYKCIDCVWSLCPSSLHTLAAVASCDAGNRHSPTSAGFGVAKTKDSLRVTHVRGSVGGKATQEPRAWDQSSLGPRPGFHPRDSAPLCGLPFPSQQAPFSGHSPQRVSDWLCP